ncbi:MAG: hypothetical protein AAGC74_07840 [Verrucomicrobiota bacterium]
MPLAQSLTSQTVANQLKDWLLDTDPLTQPSLSNALLELHSAWQNRHHNPETLLATFLTHRKRLAKKDYLRTHRFRRLLEKTHQAQLTTPTATQTLPLNLTWPSLAHLKNHLRRHTFEHQLSDWSSIQISLQPIHG